jgi:tRNA1Val (adenine37-N6)-methyltransferase
MKVTTDACLFGAWAASVIESQTKKDVQVLDIGAGTGLLSLMLAQKTEANITAIEIEALAAKQAAENCSNSPWSNRLQVIQGSIQVFDSAAKFDCIISNPPFFDSDLKSHDSSRNLALHSTELDFDNLLKQVDRYLKATGQFFVLLPAHRIGEWEQKAKQYNFFVADKVIVHQSDHHPAFRCMLRLTKKQQQTKVDQIIIKTANGYTNSFKELLHDFYLYL